MDEWMDYSELIDKVQGLIELGLYDEAIEILDDYSERNNDEWEIYYLYSRIFAEQDRPQEAIPYLHKGLRIDKTNADCLLGLYYAYSMMNQSKRGSRYLFRAYKFHPENEAVLLSLVWYYTEINESQTAIIHFEQLRQHGCTNPDAYRNGGLAYERAGQFDNAEQCFKAAIELSPNFDEVRDLLADHYLMTDQNQKAIELYQQALEISPRNIRILSKLIFCYSQTEKSDHAIALAKESIRFYPNSPVGYIDLAYIYLNLGDYDMALKSAEQALDVAPLDPEAFRIKALVYSGKKDLDNAVQAFEKAIFLDEKNTEIIRDYYHHLRESGQYDKMESWIHKVISIDHPNCMEDYWFLADYYKEIGDDLKSLHYLNRAYKNMPSEKELIPPIVDILLDKGHTKFSMPLLLRYAEKSGWNEVMVEFAHHHQLKSKWSQEGIRFLRFWTQRTPDYRKFIFKLYINKFMMVSGTILFLLSIIPIYMLFGIPGILTAFSAYLLSAGLFMLVKFLAIKQIWGFKKLIKGFS